AVRTGGFFDVQDGAFEVRGGSPVPGVWTSEVIPIGGPVRVSVDVDDVNTNKESVDFVRAYYIVDGGVQVGFGAVADDLESAVELSSPVITGSTVQIVLEGQVSANNEIYRVDNVRVLDDGGTAQDACQWETGMNAITERLESQSAAINGNLYTFAGFTTGLGISDATEIYDPSLNSWTTGTPMPTAVTHMGIAVVNEEVWVIGGFAGPHPGIPTAQVQIYNTVNDSWRIGPNLPVARGSGTATFHNGMIHYFGGLLTDRITDTGEHFVLDINNLGAGWQSRAPLPNPRNHLSSAVVDGLIYAIGGQFGHDNEDEVDDQRFLHVYDPTTNIWTRLADLPSDRSHFESSTFVVNGNIVIAGGVEANVNGDFFYDNITEYNPVTNIWTELCRLPHGLLAPSAKVINGELIVVNGGINGLFLPVKNTWRVPFTTSGTSSFTANRFDFIEVPKISVYPNPVSHTLIVDISEGSGFQIEGIQLFDISGRLVKSVEFNQQFKKEVQFEMNMTDVEAGIYILQVYSDTQAVMSQAKLVVKK
ncbi:Kelch repeat-containing protein, partial [Croceitalea sp. MTPC5]|uniref:Kelch repeat-containing protein n=1 Tax=Croceitalea sp. MTPC5 TaxID=3056565 RepID=UPI0030CF4B4C